MPEEIEIRIVKTKKDRRRFVELPWRLYSDDPNWVPPLMSDMHSTLNHQKNVLLKLGPYRFLLALRNKHVVGRIGVGMDKRLNEAKGECLSYLTLFESINDYDVAKTLFDAGLAFLKDQGAAVVTGPQSPSNGDDYRGLLIKGFDMPPVLLNSYNPPYYQALFEKYGFTKDFDRNAYFYNITDGPAERLISAVSVIEKRYGYRTRPINLKKLDREVRVLKHITDQAMPEWPDMVPPGIDEIEAEVAKLKQLAVPDLVLITETRDGEPVGFSVTLPDYNEILPKLNGRLFPFGFFKFLWHRRKIKGVRLFALMVAPAGQKKGVAACLYYYSMRNAHKHGYTHGEGSTIHEFNAQMNVDARKAGGELYKIYRIFRKNL